MTPWQRLQWVRLVWHLSSPPHNGPDAHVACPSSNLTYLPATALLFNRHIFWNHSPSRLQKADFVKTTGATYSPPSPLELHYAEATSSIHPDRPIRPLPKRRLRARLSSEVADSILYPPDPTLPRLQSQIPYDDPPSHLNGLSKELSNGNNSAMVAGTEAAKASYQFKGNEFGSEDEALIMRRPQDHRQRPASLTTSSSKIGYTKNDGSKFIKSPMPQSIASSNDSVDGYDSFENTNNKKKRKIPMSGSLGHHHSSLSAEMAQMGISSTRDIDSSHAEADSSVGHYYGSGSSAMPTVSSGSGISGAGRGRYGRAGLKHHGGRSPLGVSVNGSNTLQASRALYHRRDNANVGGAESKGDKLFSLVDLLQPV